MASNEVKELASGHLHTFNLKQSLQWWKIVLPLTKGKPPPGIPGSPANDAWVLHDLMGTVQMGVWVVYRIQMQGYIVPNPIWYPGFKSHIVSRAF